MRLSEAMLLGSVGTQQSTGALRRPGGGTCALGAAFVAAGIHCVEIPRGASLNSGHDEAFLINAKASEHARVMWPILNTRVILPVTGTQLLLDQAIIMLNDMYRWTRPQIAAWVATIEQQESGGREACSVEASKPSVLEQEQVTNPVPCPTHG